MELLEAKALVLTNKPIDAHAQAFQKLAGHHTRLYISKITFIAHKTVRGCQKIHSYKLKLKR